MSNKDIKEYKCLVFDCDGVLLNSNNVKTQAFYDVAKVYGHNPADELRKYHVQNGGISRYAKFKYFFTEILARNINQIELNDLLDNFAKVVKKGLLTCEISSGLQGLRESVPDSKWLIVTGGDQTELREVFEERGLAKFFDGGIFGSPDSKDVILEREIINNNISYPAIFFGDSKYDYQVSQEARLDFIFVSQWTEVKDWRMWTEDNAIPVINSLDEISRKIPT